MSGLSMSLEETAMNLLKSQNINPIRRTIGGDSSIVVKLIDNYTFTIREHKTKPGYLYANLKNGDVLTEWNELDEVSLPLAVDYALKYTKPNIKSAQIRKPAVILWTSAIAFLALTTGTAAYLTAQNVNSCNYQQSTKP